MKKIIKKQIAIFTDPLMGRGGGSRVVIELANYLNADIITSGFEEALRGQLNKEIKVIDIGNFFIRKNYSFGFLFEAPLRFMLYKEREYDTNIFVGNFSIFAAKNHDKNIWLCFSPNRIMYDLRDWKMSSSSLIKRFFYILHIFLFQKSDQRIAKNKMTKIIAQTENIQNRILKYYKKKSQIIYSPINTRKYKYKKVGDFFLAVSRLVPEKRMDLIARAFTKMKNKKLIIVGDGPLNEELRKIISGFNNIQLLTDISDKELVELYANCKAVIYMPKDEDFGLVPIESMASGKICVAANEGGCRETVLHKKTGYLIAPNQKEIIKKIKQLSKPDLIKMKDDCIRRARMFDAQVSFKKWDKILEGVDFAGI